MNASTNNVKKENKNDDDDDTNEKENNNRNDWMKTITVMIMTFIMTHRMIIRNYNIITVAVIKVMMIPITGTPSCLT